MSILIKNMTLPKNCAECRLCDTCECLRDFRTYEEVLDAVEDGDLTRDQNCPLVEIPGTHGRLIDKDKLRHELFTNFNGERIPFYDYDGFPIAITYRELHSILSEQKTIIEAEGEG